MPLVSSVAAVLEHMITEAESVAPFRATSSGQSNNSAAVDNNDIDTTVNSQQKQRHDSTI